MTDLEKAAAKIIDKRCSYESMGPLGELNNPGDLLVKYGKDCNYSIRDKGWSVEEKNGELYIEWMTQNTPIEKAKDMLKEAMEALGNGIKVNLHIYDRDGEESSTASFIIGGL